MRTVKPYLSFVVASRNDDHGGDLLHRMQIFLDALFTQVKRFQLPSELILVEWNPPPHKPRLKEVLQWPAGEGWCSVRIISVPKEVHDAVSKDGPLDFYQMIAKNVGICRAQGEFVLVTNIDIIFSDLLMQELAKRKLEPGVLYRCDRLDVESLVPPEAPIEEKLFYCHSNVLRVNNKYGTWKMGADPTPSGYDFSPLKKRCQRARLRAKTLFYATFDKKARKAEYLGLVDDFLGQYRKIPQLHTNACGDFTLMDRKSWEEVGGYPEFVMYSFHIDSLFLHLAYAAKKKMYEFPPEMVIYHIEHTGGWTPENEQVLFATQRKKGAHTLKYGTYLKMAERIHKGNASQFLHRQWGLNTQTLPEHTF